MAITEDQLKAYQFIFYMGMQFLLVVSAIVIQFVILYFLVQSSEWQTTAALGVTEALLTGTSFRVYGHFFPSRKK